MGDVENLVAVSDIEIRSLLDTPNLATEVSFLIAKEWMNTESGALNYFQDFLTHPDADHLPYTLVALVGGKVVGAVSQ